MKRFITFSSTIMLSLMAFGQESNIEVRKAHIDYLNATYNELPRQKLDSISEDLDFTAISNQCYQFISNPDGSKFLVFYLTDRNSEEFEAIKRDYGGTYRNSKLGGPNGKQVEAFSYIVKGMRYKGKWYYNLDEYTEFYSDSFDDAKSIFLMRSLLEDSFFKSGKTPVENKRFWKKNEFKKSYLYRDEYPGYPELVAASITRKNTRNRINLNKATENIACEISNSIWEYLRESDSDLHFKRFQGRFMDDYCLCLYNSDRNTILLPMIFYDKDRNAYLSYYVAKLSSDNITLFNWNKFPDKKIHRPPGKLSLEVIYDVRNFIQNWGWGTSNLISTNSFWEENFTNSDLQLSVYQFKNN